jgi:hypothetical protein
MPTRRSIPIAQAHADCLRKVTVVKGGATHVTDPARTGRTLCGIRWWFNCDLGTEHYCQNCQASLAKIYTIRR